MATKTISIDLEAYDRLKAVQKPGESFSEVIKRVVRKPIDVNELIKNLQKLSPEMMDAVEEQVQSRRRGVRGARRKAG